MRSTLQATWNRPSTEGMACPGGSPRIASRSRSKYRSYLSLSCRIERMPCPQCSSTRTVTAGGTSSSAAQRRCSGQSASARLISSCAVPTDGCGGGGGVGRSCGFSSDASIVVAAVGAPAVCARSGGLCGGCALNGGALE